jgi:hypothetical protein
MQFHDREDEGRRSPPSLYVRQTRGTNRGGRPAHLRVAEGDGDTGRGSGESRRSGARPGASSATSPSPAAAPPEGSLPAAVPGQQQRWHAPADLDEAEGAWLGRGRFGSQKKGSKREGGDVGSGPTFPSRHGDHAAAGVLVEQQPGEHFSGPRGSSGRGRGAGWCGERVAGAAFIAEREAAGGGGR